MVTPLKSRKGQKMKSAHTTSITYVHFIKSCTSFPRMPHV